MTLKSRFTLVGIGIVLFAIATPLIILYARGFKYDFQTGQIVKTGTLVFRSLPAKADIIVNNEKLGTTPLNVRFLIPKDYDITVSKDGYQSWSKRLPVRSQFVTWINENRDAITLFFSEPHLLKTYSATQSSISKDSSEIGFIGEQNSVNSVGVNSTNLSSIGVIASVKELFNFKGELEWQNLNQVYQVMKNLGLNYPNALLELQKAQKISTNGNYTVYIIGSNLYTLKQYNPVLISEGVLNFTLENQVVWYIQKNQIKSLDLNNNESAIITESLPDAVTGQIIRPDNQLYVILDGTLYIINGTLQKIYSPVNFAAWDGTLRQLLYGNVNEIQLYDPSTQNSQLILRSSTPILNPVLNWATGYVFYANEGKIKTIELDGRDHRNIFTITDAAKNFAVSSDGDTLYVISDSEIKIYQIR